ncbi:MAG: hypothetical protein ACLRX6_04110 [Limosilactobacillus pontis]|uniref:Uncharacterized protein n=1 Tax=Limosilactobacillus pontis TaxID=35787 RepID=A0A2J6NM27_9LACO|nr:hypothetical protein [Limosilactobacillus pontis]PMB82377.1 hypothetical protein CK797_06235 [Limosilactobacillus pontis]
MTSKDLFEIMKKNQVKVDPQKTGETTDLFEIDQHKFGYLDQYGNVYLNEYGEEKSRPLSLGQDFFSRWIHRAAEGFRTNLRRLDKWQAA